MRLLLVWWPSFFLIYISHYCIYLRLFSACFLHILPKAYGPIYIYILYIYAFPPLIPRESYTTMSTSSTIDLLVFYVFSSAKWRCWIVAWGGIKSSHCIRVIGPWSISVHGSSPRMAFYSLHKTSCLLCVSSHSAYWGCTSRVHCHGFFSFVLSWTHLGRHASYHFTYQLFICTLAKASAP